MIQIETIFDIIVKGFIIGVVVSAPLGPVGVLCIQRTLNKGRWYGFVTGLGASLSDIAYALLTGYGMSFVFDYINKNIFYLQLLGQASCCCFRNLYLSQQSGTIHPSGIVQQRFLLSQFHYRILCHALQSPDYILVYRTICPFCLCAARCRGVRRNYGISCHCFGGAGVVARNHLFCE